MKCREAYIYNMNNDTIALNLKATELAHAEFEAHHGRKPETLAELQIIWRNQSVILAGLKK